MKDERIVYRCKSPEEARRRCDRASALVGTPFLQLPGKPAQHKVLFVSSEGQKVKVSDVEMVFNDALLMDAISNWGEDGPLYQETLDTEIMREIYRYALRVFAGVDLPQQIKRPPVN